MHSPLGPSWKPGVLWTNGTILPSMYFIILKDTNIIFEMADFKKSMVFRVCQASEVVWGKGESQDQRFL